ncbi:MAG: fibronectin type III domain-containing protein, partial [Thermoplasmatales archaeon]|nr:fibronectin type III domain-containing protein [Thermoplasmatales archaeon]
MKKLNQDYKAVTVLMFLIICVGVIVSASLLQHSGSKNSFSVNIVSPAGGEAWQGNTAHTISYTISNGVANYTVELFYTTDNTNFDFIDYDNRTAEGTFDYSWTTPEITSENVKVRVNVTGNITEQVSGTSNVFEIDSTPPGEVANLSVWNTTKTSVTLNWTAPGDDNNTGTATNYDIRYSTSEINEGNWNNAIQVADEPIPASAGTIESFTVTGLNPGTTYYFALKNIDNVGLISNLSNCVNASTLLNVTLISPVGNEEWKGNTNCTIEYRIDGVESPYAVEFYYAYNNSEFILINSTTKSEAGIHQYIWTTPNILSVTVKVKINVTDNTGFSDVRISDEFEIDSIPPGKIDDLTVTGVTVDSVTLGWTAPGEDGTLYKVTNTTDEDNLPIPDNIPAGVTSNLILSDNIMIDSIKVYLRINHTYVSNLIVKLSHPDNTTATLFNRSGGSDDNIWGWYEGNTFTPDSDGSVNLQPVDDLSVFKNKGSKGVWKFWVSDNSGGESGAIDYWKIEVKTGKVATYEFRYSTTGEITEANWENATSYPAPVLGIPGTVESLHVTGLSSGVKYYFAIKSTDNVDLESDVSNSVNATTLLNVEIISPNENKLWSGESEQIIKYKFSGSKPDPYDVYDVYIWYIYDDTIVNIPTVLWHNNTGTYECSWTLPKINSTSVKIRVNISVAGHSYGEDESDNNFTIDSSSPKIISTAPANNGYVLFDENIVITFNESMNTTSVESAFSIPTVENLSWIENLTWKWNIDSTIATICPPDFFTENQLYRCIINTTAKDVSEPGNPLSEDYTFNFTVVEPLSVRVIYPNGNETWNGTKNQVIAYEISGGAPPYNVTLWVNGSTEVFIGYDNRTEEDTYSYQWLPNITNNTLKIKILVEDNTTPFQTVYDLSDWVFEIDSTAPGTPLLKDFVLEPEPDSIAKEGYPRAHAVKIKWLASGDDGSVGKVSYYHIKYSTVFIDESNWESITSYFNYTATVQAGNWDSYVIDGLEPDTTYWFALMAYDNIGFVSGLSNCVSVKTLKFETWSDTMEGVPEFEWVNNTLHIISDKTVSYTEVLMKGNLRVVNNKELKFEKVLFIMDCTEDWEYSIQVAPGPQRLEGGKFELQYSNISASVAIMPDGSEYWCPYLFVAYRNSIFWMFDSSMHHCGGKPEDIENIELDFAQIDVEIDTELGIEIRSSDVSIENSTISQNWGIFIRTSLAMQASPAIKYNVIEHNRYGIVIKPKIDIAEQWPINLVVNNISNNGVGVYSDSARVGLKGCWFTGNTYAAIYNNTPTDYPSNVSGVIYHCVFENNTHGIESKASSLRMETVTMSNNTYALNATTSVLTITSGELSDNAGGIYCSLSSLDVFDSIIKNNKSLLKFETYEKRNISEAGKADKAYPVEEEITSSGNYSYGILSLLTPTNISGTNITMDVESTVTIVTIITYSDDSKYKTTEEYSGKVGIGAFCAGSPLNFVGNTVTNNSAGLTWAFSKANITDNVIAGNLAGVIGTGTTNIPNVIDILPGIRPAGVLPFAPILRRILQGIEEISVRGAISGNSFVENEVSLIIAAGMDITIDRDTFPGDISLEGIGLLCIGSTISVNECNFSNQDIAIYMESSTVSIASTTIYGVPDLSLSVYITSSNCKLHNTIIDNGFSGIAYFDSTIDIKNSVIKNNYLTNILSLHLLYWWWYPEEAADIVEHSVLNMDNVSILKCTYYAGYGYAIGVATSNTTVTIANSNISENSVGIYCEFTDISIENVNVSDNNKDGVYVSASTLTASHVNFTGNINGISTNNAEIYVTECDFKDNSKGISSSSSSCYIESNTIRGGTGVDSSYSSLFISDSNHFIGCIAGVDSSNDFLEITGNVMEGCNEGIKISNAESANITGNNKIDGLGATGKYIRGIKISGQGSGEIYIADNEIWRYDYLHLDGYHYGNGIYCDNDASPTIVNNILAENAIGIYFKDSNENYAIIEENTIYGDACGICSVNSNLNIINNSIGWDIINDIIRWNTGSPPYFYHGIGTYGIYGQNSELNITGNDTDINHNYYGVWCEKSTISITGATVSNNSYCAYFEESSVCISNTSIVNNNLANDSYGIYLYRCPDPALPGAPVKIINSTITNNIVDLNISDSRIEAVTSTIGIIYLSSSTISSTLECIDFTPDFSNITFADNSSKMEVSFYLTVFVKWQNNEPVDNASVKIYNKNDVSTNLSTDSNGTLYTKILALKLNKTIQTTLPDGVTFMPHRVNTSRYDISNETKPFYVNETRYVELVLYDLKNPSIYINPVFFNITNKPLLTLTGGASDNIEVWKVEISTDNVTWSRCNLTVTNSTPGNYVVSWSGTVTLSEGFNTVYVMVKDFAGNNKTDSRTITLDTTPPTLIITSSIPETTNQPTLIITGETDGVNLTINTVPVPIINNTFSKTFNLNEGVNVFTVVASDALGNENRVVLSIVVFDNTPPSSGIAYIKNPINTLTSITGVANDDISGIKKVE